MAKINWEPKLMVQIGCLSVSLIDHYPDKASHAIVGNGQVRLISSLVVYNSVGGAPSLRGEIKTC